MMSPLSPTVLGLVLLALAAPVPQDDPLPPLESGDLRTLTLASPEGTRIEYFRLDLAGAEEGDPVGVVRWLWGPDEVEGKEPGRRLETDTMFFDADTRVIHTEHLHLDERKLVYREVRLGGGRTVLLQWTPRDGPRATEVVGTETVRRDLDAAADILLPLYLVELARTGAVIEDRIPIFRPLAGDVERLQVNSPAKPADGARRTLTLQRDEALLAGRYVFEDERLVQFQWQAGGPIARPITKDEYHAWQRRHRADRGH